MPKFIYAAIQESAEAEKCLNIVLATPDPTKINPLAVAE
jgi:hypothetical protein